MPIKSGEPFLELLTRFREYKELGFLIFVMTSKSSTVPLYRSGGQYHYKSPTTSSSISNPIFISIRRLVKKPNPVSTGN